MKNKKKKKKFEQIFKTPQSLPLTKIIAGKRENKKLKNYYLIIKFKR